MNCDTDEEDTSGPDAEIQRSLFHSGQPLGLLSPGLSTAFPFSIAVAATAAPGAGATVVAVPLLPLVAAFALLVLPIGVLAIVGEVDPCGAAALTFSFATSRRLASLKFFYSHR